MTTSATSSDNPTATDAPPEVQIRAFEHSLPMTLLRAREATMRQFRPMLKNHDLTDQQWRVLRALTTEQRPMTVGELVDATFLLGPSLTRILSNLVARNLIDRTVPAHDQRQGVISLTTEGAAMVSTVAPFSEATYNAIEQRFGVDKMHSLMELLHELAALGSPEQAAELEAAAQRSYDAQRNGPAT